MSELVQELPFMQGLPKREQSRFAKLWAHFRAVKAVMEKHGMIVPVQTAANLAGVSHQRIAQLIADGRLVRVDLDGHRYVTENSFVEWAKSLRKNGVPLKVDGSLMASAKFAVSEGFKKTSK